MGSNPTARSIYLYGVVAKWQGKGLQNPDHGFKSRRRLSELLFGAALFVTPRCMKLIIHAKITIGTLIPLATA